MRGGGRGEKTCRNQMIWKECEVARQSDESKAERWGEDCPATVPLGMCVPVEHYEIFYTESEALGPMGRSA